MKRFKVAFIGAGSIVFTRKILRDILTVPEFSEIEISFNDINEEYLEISRAICQHEIDMNALKIQINATTNRQEALKGAKYIINSIKVGGIEAWKNDMDIPLSYGLDQAIGDTLCAGGIMYAQRNIPVILEICKDIKEYCQDDALLINLSNPLSMCTWAANKFGNVNTIGLCHGVQLGHLQFAQIFNIPMSKIHISCIGINHCGFYTEVKTDERDLNTVLLEAFKSHPKFSKSEKIRIDMMERFGYYCTESNGHMSEYVPWYRKHIHEIEDWISYDDVFCGETKGYLNLSIKERKELLEGFSNNKTSHVFPFSDLYRSEEHLSYIIEGIETGRLYRGHLNVVNNGVIKNFIDEAIIEVPCYIDVHGISVPHIGEIDPAIAQVCNNMIIVQKLAVEAAVEGNIEKLKKAFLLDPLTAAVLNPKQIWQMADELLIADEKWLPQYSEEVLHANERIAKTKLAGTFIPTNYDIKGGALRKGEYPSYSPDWTLRR